MREKTIASGRANTNPEDFVSFASDESSSDKMEVDDEEPHKMPDKGKSKVHFEMEMDDEEIEMNSDKKKSKVHFWLTLLILILIHNTENL